MFLFEPTPDTSFYLFLGYGLAFITMGIYVASLSIRARNLKRDLEMLETLMHDEKPKK